MRKLILSLIRLFGRYTGLVLFLAICGLAAVWLSFLDSYPLAVAMMGLIVVPLVMAGIALLIGVLLARHERPEGAFVSREEAPELWRIWDELAPREKARRFLIVDDQMNASMHERRAFFGLWGSEVTMTLGLPLMLCLDLPALRSVIAHEIGHSELRHTTGTANIGEFEHSFIVLFQHADPERTLTGALAWAILGGVGGWLEREHLRQSRQNEFEADRIAARRGSPEAEARSALLGAAFISIYAEEIVKPLQQELIGATDIPPSALRRLLDRLEDHRAPDAIAAAAVREWDAAPDPASTHPSWRERIEAHGLDGMPDIGPLGEPAAHLLLAEAVRRRLIERFDADWGRCAAPLVRPE